MSRAFPELVKSQQMSAEIMTGSYFPFHSLPKTHPKDVMQICIWKTITSNPCRQTIYKRQGFLFPYIVGLSVLFASLFQTVLQNLIITVDAK
jgi:hypothetical protein